LYPQYSQAGHTVKDIGQAPKAVRRKCESLQVRQH
jgi:hypothetical protein